MISLTMNSFRSYFRSPVCRCFNGSHGMVRKRAPGHPRTSSRASYLAAILCFTPLILAVTYAFRPAIFASHLRSSLYTSSLASLSLGHYFPCVPREWPESVVHPDIFIVGFGKTGSTYLHSLLTQHPQIVEASKKEINYFPELGEELPPLSTYASYFPTRNISNPDAISIDASIGYVKQPMARDGLRRTFPCAKIIFSMRDPTVRWWSAYKHSQRKCRADTRHNITCTVPFMSIDEFFAMEMNTFSSLRALIGFTKEVQEAGVSLFSVTGGLLPHGSMQVAERLITGMYYSRIVEWLEVWPRSQVLLVNMEEYFDPTTLNDRMRTITDFVGLSPHSFEPMPPQLPMKARDHKAPGDYGPLPEPFNAAVRAFYEPELKLMQTHFGITFNATAGDGFGKNNVSMGTD